MRAAVLLEPPPETLDSLPESFRPPRDETAIREWVAHPAARRCLVGVGANERFDHAIARALGVDTSADDARVLVAHVAGVAVVDAEEWATLGLARALDGSSSEADVAIERLVVEAESHFDRGDWNAARACYAAADERLGSEASPRHAGVLVALGEIERMQGRTAESTALLDRALALAPDDGEALRGRSAIARSTGDRALAAALLARLAPQLDGEAAADALTVAAADSLAAAQRALEAALKLRPGDADLAQHLLGIYEASGNWNEAVSMRVDRAQKIDDRALRARALVDAAELCARRTGNTPRSVALYEAAIEDDPQVGGAFQAIERALLDTGDFKGVAAAYDRQLARLEAMNASDQCVPLLGKLADVSRGQLDDVARAIAALDRLLVLQPGDVERRIELGELLHAAGESVVATRVLELGAGASPAHAGTYRALYRMFAELGDADRTFAASAALVALGEAAPDEQTTYVERAPIAPIAAARPFDDDVWRGLQPEDHDMALDALLAALAEAAVAIALAERERRGALALPDERFRQNPSTTTVGAVRSFAWASRLLELTEPAVFAQADNARVGVGTVPYATPVVLLGRSVLTGRSLLELGFVAVHHMTYFRGPWRVLAYYPTLDELQALIRAAFALARPDVVAPASLDGRATALRDALDTRLDRAAEDRVTEAVTLVRDRGRRLDLVEWVRSVERIACRAALLAAGDPAVAGPALAVPGYSGGLSAAERAHELLAFSVSQRYAGLRRVLGAAGR